MTRELAMYHIHCEQCDKDYVGETSRLLETRVKEHLSRNSSADHEHCQLEQRQWLRISQNL